MVFIPGLLLLVIEDVTTSLEQPSHCDHWQKWTTMTRENLNILERPTRQRWNTWPDAGGSQKPREETAPLGHYFHFKCWPVLKGSVRPRNWGEHVKDSRGHAGKIGNSGPTSDSAALGGHPRGLNQMHEGQLAVAEAPKERSPASNALNLWNWV